MAESFPMNGGDGTYSYSRNSNYQRKAFESSKNIIKDAIMEKLDSISTPFCVADFGCSVGPNTFFAMQNVIDAVQEKWPSENVEFQIFFNDHIANDFNTLFASLPRDKQYYVAAAPGSFYNRVLPSASINVAYSSFTLHWLSRVPKQVCDRKSSAYNEGRIHYVGSSEAVVNAYTEQFTNDVGEFLSARAQEIVPGGLIFLIMLGHNEAIPLSRNPNIVPINFLDSSLTDIAKEGGIDKSKIDEFNLPIYIPTIEEVKKVIEKNGCFIIDRIELTKPWVTKLDGFVNAHGLMMHFRAGFEGLFTNHFGKEVMEKMFDKTFEKIDEISTLLESVVSIPNQFFVVLKRK